MTLLAYGQNFEDALLWRALHHVSDGFYIDIGAQHSSIDSVSRLFYDAGWRGVHVEATPAYAEHLRQDRPDEVVIQVAIGETQGLLSFFEIPETGLSTGVREIAEYHRDAGKTYHETVVPCITLADLFARCEGREIHWLKIDVEGMEHAVLTSWGDAGAKPWIVVVEATYPNSQKPTHGEWIDLLQARGYEHVFFDGVNRFFVSPDHPELHSFFEAPANVFDGFLAAPVHRLCEPLRDEAAAREGALVERQHELERLVEAHYEQIAKLEASLEDLRVRAELTLAETIRAAADREQQAVAAVTALSEAYSAEATGAGEREQWLRSQLEEAERQLRRLRDELTEESARTMQLAERQASEAREAGEREQWLRSQLEEAERQLQRLRDELTEESARAAQLAERCASEAVLAAERESALRAELHRRAEEEQRREQALRAQLRLAEQNSRLELKELTLRLAQARASVAALKSSFSWRITAPIRALSLNSGSRDSDAPIDNSAFQGGGDFDRTTDREATRPTHVSQPADGKPASMPRDDLTDLATLGGLHDTDFVQGAYRLVLDRDPEPEGLAHYLAQIRAGRSKASVIADLASSAEGRKRKLRLRGLIRYRAMKIIARIPMFGRFVEGLVFLSRAREFTSEIRSLENHLYRLTVEVDRLNEQSATRAIESR